MTMSFTVWNRRREARGLVMVAIGAACPLTCVQAADSRGDAVLQEVVVTAQKHEQNLQDVALSLTALTGADLEKLGASGFRDWAQYVPGITMYQGTSANRRAGPTAVIRGVSQTGGGQLNEVSSLATSSYMIGQVPIFSGDPGLFDINRVEVLRGPQGTLFGIASMGGTIRFIPNEAKIDTFEASVGVGTGMIQDGGSTYEVEGMVNLPLIEDKLALRLAGIKRHNDGYIDVYKLPLDATNPNQIYVDGNQFDTRQREGNDIYKDANSTDTSGARLALKFRPTDRFEVDAIAMWQRSHQATKQAIDYNDQSKDWVATRFALEPQRDQFFLGSLEASYDVGIGSFEYVGGYFDSDMSETIDATTLVTSFLNGTGANASVQALDRDGPGGLPGDPWPAPVQFPFESNTKIVSNELRLQGEAKPLGLHLFGAGATFDYVVGVFHMKEEREGDFNVASSTWNANRGPNTVPILAEGGIMTSQHGGGGYETRAVFADVALRLIDKLVIGVGARYSDSERDSFANSWNIPRAANGQTGWQDFSGPPDVTSPGRITDRGITPRYTMKYELDDDRMLFATVAKGQRMPSSFPRADYWNRPEAPTAAVNNPECQNLARSLGVYDDAENGTSTDHVWSYDLGLKSTWLEHRLQVNTSVYYLDWANLQRNVQMSQFIPGCNILIPANVGGVEIKGAELEVIYLPTDWLTVNASVGYTDAQVAETVLGVNDSLGQQLEKGDSIENVAPWTGAVGVEARFDLATLNNLLDSDFMGFARLDWRYADERLGTNVGDAASIKADPVRSWFVSQPYDLTDLRFGVRNDAWTITAYVSNVFNERAMFESFRQAWLPNQRIVSASQPRTVGVTVKRSF